MNQEADHSVVFFDGVCNLCNGWVDLVIRRDKNSYYHFASLQSDYSKEQLPKYGVNPTDLDSIALLDKGQVYQKSTAALKIASRMSGLYPLLGVFWVVPKFIRDAVYDFIARNRYKWFGRKDSCRMPTDAERALFIE